MSRVREQGVWLLWLLAHDEISMQALWYLVWCVGVHLGGRSFAAVKLRNGDEGTVDEGTVEGTGCLIVVSGAIVVSRVSDHGGSEQSRVSGCGFWWWLQ